MHYKTTEDRGELNDSKRCPSGVVDLVGKRFQRGEEEEGIKIPRGLSTLKEGKKNQNWMRKKRMSDDFFFFLGRGV